MCTTQGITFSALPWPKPAWPVQSGITETAASFSHATTTPLLSDLSHIKVLLSSTYHATKTPLFSDLSYKGTFFKYLSCYHNPTLFKLHMIVTITSTYQTSLVPKISDLLRLIHTKVPITSTCHATKTPDYFTKNVPVPFISIPCSRASNASDIPCSKFITGGRIAHKSQLKETRDSYRCKWRARLFSALCVCNLHTALSMTFAHWMSEWDKLFSHTRQHTMDCLTISFNLLFSAKKCPSF